MSTDEHHSDDFEDKLHKTRLHMRDCIGRFGLFCVLEGLAYVCVHAAKDEYHAAERSNDPDFSKTANDLGHEWSKIASGILNLIPSAKKIFM